MDLFKNLKQVTITELEYKMLKDDRLLLKCLYNVGVDNWSGYDIAIDEYNELGGE